MAPSAIARVALPRGMVALPGGLGPLSLSLRHLAGSPLQVALKRTVAFEASATVELYLRLLNPGENSKLNNYIPLPLFSSVEADGAGFPLREGPLSAQGFEALEMTPG